jgi:hypothetical protein
MGVLLDELTTPPLRVVIGRLLGTAATADIAVSTIHLAALDLSADETAGVARCRILLGRLDARELGGIGAHGSATDTHLRALLEFLLSGRVEIRSAGMAAWLPDFSLYAGLRPPGPPAACVVGAHYFRTPVIADGPSLTCVLFDAAAVARAARRFEMLWERAHDVQPAVVAALERVLHEQQS